MDQFRIGSSVDITNCEREPIHIPGSIQPHGVLFVLDEPTLTIIQVSENITDFFGLPFNAVLNRPLDAVIGVENSALLKEIVQKDLQSLNSLILSLERDGEVNSFEGVLHRSDGLLILELERAQQNAPAASLALYNTIMQIVSRFQKAANLRELCQTSCEEIFKLSSFDQVMLYRFDEQWNGTVIAEARRADRASYLGLHFPASDIPAQARGLYLRNWLRVIPNMQYQPVALMPAFNPRTGTALDMSHCTLRSVSPIHTEYMRNMGVSATMTISLITGETLWGLLVCHHQIPIYLSHTIRYACELVGQIASSFLLGKEQHDHFLYEWKIRTMQGSLLANLPREANLVEGLIKYGTSMLELVQAPGLVIEVMDRYVALGGVQRCVRIGQCPEEADVMKLVEWLQQNMRGDIYVTDTLPKEYEPAQQFKDVASGLLAISLSSDKSSLLLWFRPEVIQTTVWGGDPAKSILVEKENAQLHPRKSFEAWKQTTYMTSPRWQQNEVDAAVALRSILIEMAKRDQIIKRRLRAWLRRD